MSNFERACRVIPGGVNSPVRAFGSVGGEPFFVNSADGSKLYDITGKKYIDYICSWGALILGHRNEDINDAITDALVKGVSYGAATLKEVELAEMICDAFNSIEMVRMVNSGTEAAMSAIRLARAYTGRDKIIKFEGCYHGHSDSLLVSGGSGMLTYSVPSSPGVPKDITKNTLVASFNNLESVEELFINNKGSVACIIVEPVCANMGVVAPKEGFLNGLRDLCDKYNALLIFDEVITGFRLAYGGAQEYFGIDADLTVLGKIIGGGLPVGAYGGRADIMKNVSPAGQVYQAGTLSGNPLAMAAGIASLKQLSKGDFYKKLEERAEILWSGIRENLKKLNNSYCLNTVGSLGTLFFVEKNVETYADAMSSSSEKYAKYFHGMASKGVYIAPSQFEAMFISSAHTHGDISDTLKINYEVLSSL